MRDRCRSTAPTEEFHHEKVRPLARVLILLTISALATGGLGPPAFGQATAPQKKPAARPELGILPKELRFPAQEVATHSAPRAVILTNRTQQELKIDRVTASGEFRLVAPGFPQKIRPGGSTAAVVTFNPEQEGLASGALTILSSPGGKAWTVPLSGKATNFGGCSERVRVCADLVLAIVLCVFYWLAMVVVRWHRVAWPTRELLRAQIWSLQTELDILLAHPPADSNGTRSEKLKTLQLHYESR